MTQDWKTLLDAQKYDEILIQLSKSKASDLLNVVRHVLEAPVTEQIIDFLRMTTIRKRSYYILSQLLAKEHELVWEKQLNDVATLCSAEILDINGHEFDYGSTVFLDACADQDMPLIKFLLEQGADINERDYYNCGAMIYLWGLCAMSGMPTVENMSQVVMTHRFLVRHGVNEKISVDDFRDDKFRALLFEIANLDISENDDSDNTSCTNGC